MIRISCDSTADLSAELYQKYNIARMPLYINLAGHEYEDGIDITADRLFELVKETGELPMTAARNIDDFIEYIKGVKAEGGADEVIHFAISGEFSTTCNMAKMAAKEMEGVYVVDSRNLSTGIGLSVLAACEMAASGMKAEEIVRIVEDDIIPKVDASFVLDTLSFMAKGGRCSSVVALGANLLKLKPSIEVVEGKMRVGKKYRGSLEHCLKLYIADRLADLDGIRPDRIFVTSSGCSKEIQEACVAQVKALGYFKEILCTEAGCTVSSHCGPGTLGVLFIHK